ncbi:MAG: tRNA (adenosine(37)-N6)-threonylcarbamoyltransferase complex ATPase subunit type 1 TsaE [Clostridia bacterium]|nr:tRNA (adenosine(37)-N6)-threonylcarbamoyltransferase complex ATPase subunit type 1 TsaE [Clostridia bacterium]
MRYTTHSESDTLSFAARLSPMLAAGDTVLLVGDLGAGKSVLARGIARGMGIAGPMPSPTFTLMVPYEAGGRKLYHFDLYRLSDPDEYYAAGLDEFVGGDGVAVVEWPQMAELDPVPALTITLTRTGDDDTRRVEIENNGVAGFDPAALSDWRDDHGV